MIDAMSDHIRFAVLAADTALFTVRDRMLYTRLIRVTRPPHFPNGKGLPGGLLNPEETAEASATRHLSEKARIDEGKVYSEQLYTFSAVDRDPRGRVVAVAYLALVPWAELSSEEQSDSEEAYWCRVDLARGLAYDHDEVLKLALTRLKSRVTYTTLIGKLMPSEFTLTELEQSYEAILGTGLDKRNFRKKILKLGFLKELAKKRTGGRFRPAKLYRFASPAIKDIEVI